MSWLNRCALRVKSLLNRERFEAGMAEELRFHIEMQTEENVRGGMDSKAAKTAALCSLGAVEPLKEDCRSARGLAWLETLLQDLRFGVRSLLKKPEFSLVAILTLALGIGGITAMFSVVHAVLLRPLGYKDPDQLVILRTVNTNRGMEHEGLTGPNYLDLKKQNRCFAALAAYSWTDIDLTDQDGSGRIQGLEVTADFFDLIGIQPSPGRAFTVDEQRRDDRVIFLAGRVWQRYFGAKADKIGKSVHVYSWESWPDGGAIAYHLIGVVRQDIPFLPTTSDNIDAMQFGVDDHIDFWTPLAIEDSKQRHGHYNFRVIARLKTGITVPQARAELRTIAARLEES